MSTYFPLLYSLAGAASAESKKSIAEDINVEFGLAGDAVMTDGDISSLGASDIRARLLNAKAKGPAALHTEAAKIKADATKQKSGAGEFQSGKRGRRQGRAAGGSTGRVLGSV